MFFIGVCTGLVAVIIDTIVEYTSAAKYSYVAKREFFSLIMIRRKK